MGVGERLPQRAELHPLVLRQLRRLGLDTASLPPSLEAWQALLERVANAYRAADQDRYLLERSQEVSSRELLARAHELRTNEARLASLLSLSSDWVWETDADGRLSFLSEGWLAASGVEPSEALGKHLPAIEGIEVAPDQLRHLRRALRDRRPFRDFVFDLVRRDGERHYLRLSGAPIVDAGGTFRGFRGVGADVTEATQAARRAEHMARFDSLTGLPNRAQLGEALDSALVQARRRQGRVAVMFIDLDGFKHINDNLGHAAGDELLQLMARRLASVVRQGDLVARLGGDEFVVMLEPAGDTAALHRVANRLLALLSDGVVLDGRPYELSGSVGISVFPDDADSAEALLRHADAAMYLAKEEGKNRFHFYTSDLAARTADQFALESDLRVGIDRDELILHYQPKFELSTGRLTGVEALVRWRHPERGLVMPGEFVALAERRGLILPLGRWVIGAACRQLREWLDAGVPVPQCAINLSPQQFNHEGLIDDIQDALTRWSIPPGRLEVEITEGMVMRDPERANRMLEQLSALGLCISIDDFGTGYSSLNYLKRFPADTLKLDRSFVSGLPADENDAAISRAVVAMAHGLGMKVVAEGVENVAQLNFLRALRCDEVQGYLLGRPVPADRLQTHPPIALDAWPSRETSGVS